MIKENKEPAAWKDLIPGVLLIALIFIVALSAAGDGCRCSCHLSSSPCSDVIGG